mgnify:CR=1 FL=1
MPQNKHQIIRYQALDKCFRNSTKRYFIDNLIDACNEAIYNFTGNSEGIKKRQIYDDIAFMQSENGYAAPIEKDKMGEKYIISIQILILQLTINPLQSLRHRN